MENIPELQQIGMRVISFTNLKKPQDMKQVMLTLSIADSEGKILESQDCCVIETLLEDGVYKTSCPNTFFALKMKDIPKKSAFILELKHYKHKAEKFSTKCWSYVESAELFEWLLMEDKGKMDELIEQMKLMNERLGKMDERMEKMTKLLGQSMYHQQRTDFTSEYVARQQGYTGFINEDIAVAPKPPSRLFGNHFIKIRDERLGEEISLRERGWANEGDILLGNSVGKRSGIIDSGVDDIHDYMVSGNIQHYLQSLTEDDTDKEDFVWLKGVMKLGLEIERRPFKEGEAKVFYSSASPENWSEKTVKERGSEKTVNIVEYTELRGDKANLEKYGYKFVDEKNLTEVEITHGFPVLTEMNDLGGEMRRTKAAAEEKEKQERLNREEDERQERLKREEKERQERLVREELTKKRKYEEDLRNRTQRGEKFEFTPEQLHEIVNNTPEGQRLLQEKKRSLEEDGGGVPREDSRVASLAEKFDEDLVVVEASSVGN